MRHRRLLLLLCLVGLLPGEARPQAAASAQVRLAWDAPPDGPWPAGVAARLYRQTACVGAWTLVGTAPDANALQVADASAERGARYCYLLRAADAYGESLPSNTVDLTLPAALGVPGALRAHLVITVPLGP